MDFNLFRDSIYKLSEGNNIDLPIYDFGSHRR
jgi:uridine kinase